MATSPLTVLGRHNWGDKILVVALVEAGTTFTAVAVGLSRIENVWFQDVDDTNQLAVSVYSGTSVTYEAIAGGTQLGFVVGY
jgi:hypothetical protein